MKKSRHIERIFTFQFHNTLNKCRLSHRDFIFLSEMSYPFSIHACIANWLILMTFFRIWLTKDEFHGLYRRICVIRRKSNDFDEFVLSIHEILRNWLTIDEIEINKCMFRFFQDEIEWSKNGFERTLCEFDRENL